MSVRQHLRPAAAEQRETWSGPGPSRLLIVDDQPAVLAGLRDLLADERDFDVAAAVPSAEAIHTRFGHDEQAIFGMLLAGIEPDEIADTQGLSAAALDSSLWTMLRKLETSR